MKENNDHPKALEIYLNLRKEIQHYQEITGIAHWDMMTMAPKAGKALHSEALGTLSTEAFKRSISKEMEEVLEALMEKGTFETLDRKYQRSVEKDYKGLQRFRKIPEKEYREYVVLTSKAQNVWEEARENNDFQLFQPYLEKIIDFNRRAAELFGYEEHPYNALLDHYEEGMTVKELDDIFSVLKKEIIKLLQTIQESSVKPLKKYDNLELSVEKQKILSRRVLEMIGYDFSAGRLDESVHPFTIGLNPKDVRLTTRYRKDFFKMALYGTIHEGGHGMYEQNIPMELFGTSAGSAASTGIHESQSRFWENVIGRSEEFWIGIIDEFKEIFGEEAKEVTLEEMVPYVNIVEPSLIRVEADELTYSLHIILRYELEKDLLTKKISVAELPEKWNAKMQEMMGLLPENDRVGVLQDVHWSGGMIGYFPTYALGNIYSAQLAETMEKDLPDYRDLVKNRDFEPIKQWMVEKVHSRGSLLTAKELLKEITGSALTSEPYIRYLTEKYRRIYKFSGNKAE